MEITLQKVPAVLKVLTSLQSKTLTQSEINDLLDDAWVNLKKLKKEKKKHYTAFFRLLLAIGDISRKHDYFKELGIESNSGGFQMRENFRSILRWIEKNHSKFFYKNLYLWVQHTTLNSVLYNELRTDRKTGKVLSIEINEFDMNKVTDFLVNEYKEGRITLLAKHMPKWKASQFRTVTINVKHNGNVKVPLGRKYYKKNGKIVEPKESKIKGEGTIDVKEGDQVRYPKPMQEATIERNNRNNALIALFCEKMQWEPKLDKNGNVLQYPKYRAFKKLQGTPEQSMSTLKVLNMDKAELWKFFDQLPSTAKRRVQKSLLFKKNDRLQPKEKWGDVATTYLEWLENQNKVAEEIRKSPDELTRSTKLKELKVKTVGMTSQSILGDMIKRIGSTNFKDPKAIADLDTDYTAMVSKMEFNANVSVWLDISGSMEAFVNEVNLSRLQLASAIATTFAINNPNPMYRNTIGVFARQSEVVGAHHYSSLDVNQQINRYTFNSGVKRGTNAKPIFSDKDTFSANFARLASYTHIRSRSHDWTASTDPSSAIEYFVSHVKKDNGTIEDLPHALLMISDGEFNNGRTPARSLVAAQKKAEDIGWTPLIILWDITSNSRNQFKDLENVLHLGGFNESVLSQIIKGIKVGSVDPFTSIQVINDDPRYQQLIYA